MVGPCRSFWIKILIYSSCVQFTNIGQEVCFWNFSPFFISSFSHFSLFKYHKFSSNHQTPFFKSSNSLQIIHDSHNSPFFKVSLISLHLKKKKPSILCHFFIAPNYVLTRDFLSTSLFSIFVFQNYILVRNSSIPCVASLMYC